MTGQTERIIMLIVNLMNLSGVNDL